MAIFSSIARSTLRETGPIGASGVEEQADFMISIAQPAVEITLRTVLNFNNNRTTSGARDSTTEQAGGSRANALQFAEEATGDNTVSQEMFDDFFNWHPEDSQFDW